MSCFCSPSKTVFLDEQPSASFKAMVLTYTAKERVSRRRINLEEVQEKEPKEGSPTPSSADTARTRRLKFWGPYCRPIPAKVTEAQISSQVLQGHQDHSANPSSSVVAITLIKARLSERPRQATYLNSNSPKGYSLSLVLLYFSLSYFLLSLLDSL